MKKSTKEQTCRFCGCTQEKACIVDGLPCRWVYPDICSACMKPGLRIQITGSRLFLGRWLEIGTEGILKEPNGDNYMVEIANHYYCCLAPYDFKVIAKPKIVCLCGSTRFKNEFIKANFEETKKGNIILTVGWFSHSDAEIYYPTPEEKLAFDQLHKRKIDLADEVFIINVGGYIGESTKSEIEYARLHGKAIRFLEPEK
jgi:hypothetical protein